MKMAKEFDNELRGVLFKNDKKQNDKHPDYKGQCQVSGVEYWVSAWIKSGNKGKFLSLSFSTKDAKPAGKKSAPPSNDFDDELPPF
jgi:uncharacterized protein (DUF736 family)